MAKPSYVVFGWSWTEVSVLALGSQVFGEASTESCASLVEAHQLFVNSCAASCQLSLELLRGPGYYNKLF